MIKAEQDRVNQGEELGDSVAWVTKLQPRRMVEMEAEPSVMLCIDAFLELNTSPSKNANTSNTVQTAKP